MKTMIYKINWLLVIFITTNCNINAQCSEAENATMKKYAELTRTGDTQACSQCAWLANLFCIAENGLYKNDKSEVQNAIDATKQNIKFMGDPICCPELLTKNPNWGQPKKEQGTEEGAGTKNKTVEDIQEVVQYGVNHIENISQTKTNQKDIKKSTEIIEKNSTLLGSRYSSKQEIEAEYQYKLENIDNTSDMFVKSRVKNAELGVERGRMSNDQVTAMASNIFGGLETAMAQSDAIKLLEFKKKKLASQKKYLDSQFDIIEAINKERAIILNNEVLRQVVEKSGTDYSAFNNHTIVQGWNPTMKLKDFKKIFKKDKPKTIAVGQHYKGLHGAYGLWEFEDLRFEVIYENLTHQEGLVVKKGYNSKAPYKYEDYVLNNSSLRVGYEKDDEIVVQIVKPTTAMVETFSTEKLKEFQNKLLEKIQDYSNLFNIRAESSNINIATLDPFAIVPFQMVTTVIWKNENQKAYALVGQIFVQGEKLGLLIKEGDLSLASPAVIKDLNSFASYNSEGTLITN